MSVGPPTRGPEEPDRRPEGAGGERPPRRLSTTPFARRGAAGPRDLQRPHRRPQEPQVRGSDPDGPEPDKKARPTEKVDKDARKAARQSDRDQKAATEIERLKANPRVVGESKFDRVSSGLMSAILGAGCAVGWLYLMVLTQQSFADRAPATGRDHRGRGGWRRHARGRDGGDRGGQRRRRRGLDAGVQQHGGRQRVRAGRPSRSPPPP